MILDAAIVGVIGLFVWRGMRRGLLATLIGYLGFVAAVAAAVFGYRAFGAPLEHGIGLSAGVANLAGALAVFAGVSAGVWFLGRALTRVLRLTRWGAVNAAAGGALSGFWALTTVTLVLLATTVLPLSQGAERRIDSSALATAILEEAPGWMNAVARSDLRRMLTLFTGSDAEAEPSPSTG